MQRFIRDGERKGERRTPADWAALHFENRALYEAKERLQRAVPSFPRTEPVPFRGAFAEWCALTPAEKGAYTVMSVSDFYDAMDIKRRHSVSVKYPWTSQRDNEGMLYAQTHAKGFALLCCELTTRDLTHVRDAWRSLALDEQRAYVRRVPYVSEALFVRLSQLTPGRGSEPVAPSAFAVYIASPARRDRAARLIQQKFVERVYLNPRSERTRRRLEKEAENELLALGMLRF